MIVSELIRLLQQMPGNADVVFDGGFDPEALEYDEIHQLVTVITTDEEDYFDDEEVL